MKILATVDYTDSKQPIEPNVLYRMSEPAKLDGKYQFQVISDTILEGVNIPTGKYDFDFKSTTEILSDLIVFTSVPPVKQEGEKFIPVEPVVDLEERQDEMFSRAIHAYLKVHNLIPAEEAEPVLDMSEDDDFDEFDIEISEEGLINEEPETQPEPDQTQNSGLENNPAPELSTQPEATPEATPEEENQTII